MLIKNEVKSIVKQKICKKKNVLQISFHSSDHKFKVSATDVHLNLLFLI